MIEITGFKVFESPKGFFAKEPQHKGVNKDGEETWYDDVRFLKKEDEETSAIRDEVMDAIITAYNQSSNTYATQRSNTSQTATTSRTAAAKAQTQVNNQQSQDRFPW